MTKKTEVKVTGSDVQALVDRFSYDLQVTFFNDEKGWLEAAARAQEIVVACRKLAARRREEGRL